MLANLDAAQAAGSKLQLERRDLRDTLRRIHAIAMAMPDPKSDEIVGIINRALK